MRTIKFRAWHIADKQMFYEGHTKMPNGNCIYSSKTTLFMLGESAEIMQFTGLTDKNGKEIYEGDILKVYKPNTWLKFDDFHVVKYHETQAKFAYWCVRIRDWTTSNTGLFNIGENQHGRWCEVIGNIYENQNLLK